MESSEKCTPLDRDVSQLNMIYEKKCEGLMEHHHNIKVEKVDELDCLDPVDGIITMDGIKCEKNSVDQHKIKIETLDELVDLNSTNACSSINELENVYIKSELESEELDIPFKISKDFLISIKECNKWSTQDLIKRTTKGKQKNTVLKQNILSRMSRDQHHILKSKDLCKQCCFCGRVFLASPDYFLFHLLCYHTSEKFLKGILFNKGHHFNNPSKKTKVILNTTSKYDHRMLKSKERRNQHCLSGRKICSKLKGGIKRVRSMRFKQFNKKPNITVQTGSHTCEICLKQLLTKSQLTCHMRYHTGEKPFKCEICLKRFMWKDDLTSHMRSHNGEKPNVCEVCFKEFISSSNLIRHMRSHTGEKPFQCETCLKQFTQKNSLITHTRHHTGERPFKCEICFKQFTHKNSLKYHMRGHTGDKPFECELCSKQFILKNDLITHTRCHTGERPFKCEICFKQFTQNGHLKIHMLRHADEKPFKCELCSKQFILKNDLITHTRCHTGERPFKCEICFWKFANKSRYLSHTRSHVDEKPFEGLCPPQRTVL